MVGLWQCQDHLMIRKGKKGKRPRQTGCCLLWPTKQGQTTMENHAKSVINVSTVSLLRELQYMQCVNCEHGLSVLLYIP